MAKNKFKMEKVDIRYSISIQLRKIREEKGMTIEEAGLASGMQASGVQKLEMGAFKTLDGVIRLTNCYGKKLTITIS